MIDSRVRVVLVALKAKGGTAFGNKIINQNEGDSAVVAATLRNARLAGLADFQMVKKLRLWSLTEAGERAIEN